MVFEIYDIITVISDFVSIKDFDNFKLVNKTVNECVNDRIDVYKKATRKIEFFIKSREVKIENILTRRSLIRLYVRTYTDDMVKNIYSWSYPKVKGLLNNNQINIIDKYINDNPIFSRRNMYEYLSIFSRNQLCYIGY